MVVCGLLEEVEEGQFKKKKKLATFKNIIFCFIYLKIKGKLK